jgi:branched-chain amino acid transport system permease protein
MEKINLIQVLLYSIFLGGIYAITAIGLNLIFGVMKIVNFSHGVLVMLGAYFAFWIWKLYGISPYISTVFCFIILMFLGFGIYGLIKKFEGERDFELLSLVITFGISIFIVNLVRYIWTSRFRGVFLLLESIDIFGMTLSTSRIIPFAIGLIITIALYFYMKKSFVGRALRAVSQDAEASQLMGINKRNMYLISCGIGCGLAGVAGSLFCTIYAIYPEMGFSFTVLAFCIVVLGGLGSFKGTLIASFILAISEGLTGFIFGSGWKPFAGYFIIITVLLLRGRYLAVR